MCRPAGRPGVPGRPDFVIIERLQSSDLILSWLSGPPPLFLGQAFIYNKKNLDPALTDLKRRRKMSLSNKNHSQEGKKR